MAINGNRIILKKKVGNTWTQIGYIRSQEPEASADLQEVSSPNQGLWRQFITGRKQWSMTANWIMGVTSQLSTLLEVGDTFRLRCQDRSNSSVYVEGEAILERVKITMTRGNIVQGSFVFRGNGALTNS